jgi:hypothetical protein
MGKGRGGAIGSSAEHVCRADMTALVHVQNSVSFPVLLLLPRSVSSLLDEHLPSTTTWDTTP